MNKIFIPIKHRSQRVPEKNFRLFGKEPLWKRCISKLKNDLDNSYEIFINTDSKIILESDDSILNDINVIERKKNLIGHDVPVTHLLLDFICDHCSINDKIAQIHVTSPFIKTDLINHIFRLLDNYDSVTTVDEIKARAWRQYTTPQDKYENINVALNHDPRQLLPTQRLEPIYIENSLIYGFNALPFLTNSGDRMCGNNRFVKTTFPENIDIDTEEDWKYACMIEKLINQMENNK